MEYINGLDVPVIFNKSRRAKRLIISVKPFKPIRISFPPRIPLIKAQQFLQTNIEWLKKALLKVKEMEKQQKPLMDLPKINKAQAKLYLSNQLKFLADKYNFSYNRVFIRNQKTRWGSCSGRNNINLNINIVRLEPHLQDYILLHELVHTRIKNHSRKFWNELDKYVGNAKYLAKLLRNHNLSMFHFAA